ncbi:MAG: hypothetical protein CME85_12035 [Henriciella sp.]|nr:DUF3137 domain-containing protein [Henriciella sp.]MBK76206.1 hypothetical protein [Henriciella sp.]
MTTDITLEDRFARLSPPRPEHEGAALLWRDKLHPRLEEMEAARKSIIRRATLHTLAVGVFIAALTAAAFIAFGFETVFPFGIFAAVVATFIACSAVWMPVFTMKSQTKELVVGAACEPFGFRYQTLHMDMSGVSGLRSLGTWISTNRRSVFSSENAPPTPAFDRLKAVGLLPSYDTRKFEDLIEGQRANADFTLVECKLTEQRGSGKNRRTVTTFQGLLLNIDYPDRFLGRTLIARDGWWSWGRKNGMQQVDLVSKELEDAFTVYSTDQVEARTLLTQDRMERLIALERHFKGGKLRGVFEEGHLTLALEADNQFEAGSIFKPLADPDRYVETLTEIGLVCDLIDGFLTREWYKDKI